MWACAGIAGCPVPALAVNSGVLNSVSPDSEAPDPLARPMTVLLVLQVVAVPVLHEDANLAGDQVTVAAYPRPIRSVGSTSCLSFVLAVMSCGPHVLGLAIPNLSPDVVVKCPRTS